jgi:hypothetical protein
MFAPARVDAGHFICRIQLNAAPLKSEKFCFVVLVSVSPHGARFTVSIEFATQPNQHSCSECLVRR